MTTTLATRYGQWAIVTGASDGIGRAFAIELAREGVNLILVARRENLLNTLAAELKASHQIRCEVLPLDLSDAAACDRLMSFTQSFDVGLLVAAAGFGTSGPLIHSDLNNEIDMLEVNCRAVLQLAHRFGNRFVARYKSNPAQRSGMLLFSSIVAFQGVPRAANYAATKAYVQSLAEGLHHELKPLGVDVLAVAPGPVSSGFGNRANMLMGNAMPASAVAKPSLRALGGTTVRPGLLSKILGYSLATTPRFLRSRILTGIMGKMTAHHKN